LLEKLDVSLGVCQHCPKTLNDAVSATLEIESLGNQQTLNHSTTSTVANVNSPINTSKDDIMYEMLQTLVSRMNQMELTIAHMDNQSSYSTSTPRLVRGQEKEKTDSDQSSVTNAAKLDTMLGGCANRQSTASSGN